MKTIYKICLVNMGLALVFALLFSFSALRDSPDTFIPVLGIVSLFGGVINIIIGLLLLAFRRKVWGQGYLLSAGMLLLLGFALCSVTGVV